MPPQPVEPALRDQVPQNHVRVPPARGKQGPALGEAERGDGGAVPVEGDLQRPGGGVEEVDGPCFCCVLCVGGVVVMCGGLLKKNEK